MSYRAIGLCRLSTEEQATEGRAGLARQREEIQLAAQRYDVEVIEVEGNRIVVARIREDRPIGRANEG